MRSRSLVLYLLLAGQEDGCVGPDTTGFETDAQCVRCVGRPNARLFPVRDGHKAQVVDSSICWKRSFILHLAHGSTGRLEHCQGRRTTLFSDTASLEKLAVHQRPCSRPNN